MLDATSRRLVTPAPGDVARLGAREAARQAALLRMPEPSRDAAGRSLADPLPGPPSRAGHPA